MSFLETYEKALNRPFGQAGALPFAAYTDPEIYELERQKLAYHSWVPMCPAGLLAKPGDYFAVDVAAEPVLVIRGEDGALRALSNVCRHRGTPLAAEGYGNATTFVCAFHAWSYDTTGKLLAVPHPGSVKIDRAAHCLPQFALEVWHNMIFINLDPDPEPFARSVEGVDECLALCGATTADVADVPQQYHDWNTNWKLAAENSIEPYHLFQLHRTTLDPTTPTSLAFNVAGSPRWTVSGGRLVGDFAREYWTQVAIHPFFIAVQQPPPLGQDLPDTIGWQGQIPGAEPERCKVAGGGILLPKVGGVAEEQATTSDDVYEFFYEDMRQCELQQRAMRARKTRGGQYVELERVVVDLYNHLAWRVFDREPQPAWTDRKPE